MNQKRFAPINPKFPHFLHGGDYNPEQWKDYLGIWDEDMRLMKLSGCNAMSVGIFAWTALEPAEGKFEFGWLDTILASYAEDTASFLKGKPNLFDNPVGLTLRTSVRAIVEQLAGDKDQESICRHLNEIIKV